MKQNILFLLFSIAGMNKYSNLIYILTNYQQKIVYYLNFKLYICFFFCTKLIEGTGGIVYYTG